MASAMLLRNGFLVSSIVFATVVSFKLLVQHQVERAIPAHAIDKAAHLGDMLSFSGQTISDVAETRRSAGFLGMAHGNNVAYIGLYRPDGRRLQSDADAGPWLIPWATGHATHDALTGLLNRQSFSSEVETRLRRGDICRVGYVDADRLEEASGRYGSLLYRIRRPEPGRALYRCDGRSGASVPQSSNGNCGNAPCRGALPSLIDTRSTRAPVRGLDTRRFCV